MSSTDTTETEANYVYVYDAVRDLAAVYLPRNRSVAAQRVDKLLVARDETISELQRRLFRANAAIERYQLENSQVRGLVGNLRRAMSATLEAVGPALVLLRDAHQLPIPQPPRDPEIEVKR